MIELLSHWLIRNRENTGDPAVRMAYGRLCGLVGIGLNLLLFGGKKIPELMKGIGKGVRSFKEGMNEVEDNLKETDQKKEETTSNEKKEK